MRASMSQHCSKRVSCTTAALQGCCMHLQVAPVAHDCVQFVQARVGLLLCALRGGRGEGALALLPALEPMRHQPGVHDRR